MSYDPKELLIEQATSAYRERSVQGRIMPSPAWWDLPPEDRDLVYSRQLESRVVERSLDPEGLSATVRAVMGRLRG